MVEGEKENMLCIDELMNENLILLDLKNRDKGECLEEIAELLVNEGRVTDKTEYLDAVLKREALGATGIGMQVAIPHGKSRAVLRPSLVMAKSAGGVDFQAPDKTLANLIFLIAVPDHTDDLHLKILAGLARSLMHTEFRNQLLGSNDKRELLKILEGGITV